MQLPNVECRTTFQAQEANLFHENALTSSHISNAPDLVSAGGSALYPTNTVYTSHAPSDLSPPEAYGDLPLDIFGIATSATASTWVLEYWSSKLHESRVIFYYSSTRYFQ